MSSPFKNFVFVTCVTFFCIHFRVSQFTKIIQEQKMMKMYLKQVAPNAFAMMKMPHQGDLVPNPKLFGLNLRHLPCYLRYYENHWPRPHQQTILNLVSLDPNEIIKMKSLF